MSRAALEIAPPMATLPVFSQEQLQMVSEMFFALTGNKLGPEKRSLIESRLRKRLMATNLTQAEYFKLLESSQTERAHFITALTTHKTDWFREKAHLDFLAKRVHDPAFLKQRSGPISVWSAACSTGEEPYSIAMTLLEQGIFNFQILGTDISRECVEQAKSAVYSSKTVDAQVPNMIKKKYFLRGTRPDTLEQYRFNPEYRNNFKFQEFNLVSSVLMVNVRFDFIFLRNVLIYFDQEAGYEIVKRLCNYLKPGGYFVLGLSEAVTKPEQLGLKQVGNSTFTLCR